MNKKYELVVEALDTATFMNYITDLYNKAKAAGTELAEKFPKIVFGAGAGVGSFIYFVIQGLLELWQYSSILASSQPVHKRLTEVINDVMGEKNTWVVHVIKSKDYNAFTFSGKHMYVFSALVNDFTEEETIAICLHEIGHSSTKDSLTAIATSSTLGAIFVSAMVFLGFDINENLDYRTGNATLKGITHNMVVGLICLIFLIGTYLGIKWIDRKLEYKSDDFAVKKGYGKQLISGFKKMIAKYKIGKKVCKTKLCVLIQWLEEITSTHPTMSKRIEKILINMTKIEAKSGGNKKKAIAMGMIVAGVSKDETVQTVNSMGV